MIAVVAGMIATFPIGGVVWDYGQYALGLERLGFEVYYVEDTDFPSYHPQLGRYVDDPAYSVEFLGQALEQLSPALGQRWALRAVNGSRHGPKSDQLNDLIASADLFLNVSGGCVLRPEYLDCTHKVLIDTDPGWNHFVVFPASEQRTAYDGTPSFRDHDYFCTYAQRLNAPDCRIPALGLDWHPTYPPVIMDQWARRPPAQQWTTIMSWDSYRRPIVHNGVSYGNKDQEFWGIKHLPSQVSVPFEVAIGGVNPPINELQKHGWRVRDPREVSTTAVDYQHYISTSRGEFSVAKNVYVATRSGWFSCRSTCYLAAGRPVVLQDTGFSELIPTGCGLLTFTNAKEAIDAITNVENNYTTHQAAARQIAAEHFASDIVLTDLLNHVGIR